LKVAHDEHKAAIASRDGERIKASIKLPAFAASLLHYAQGVVNKFGANAAVTFALANIEATEAKLQIALARIKTLEQSGANGTSKFSLPVYDEGKIIGSQQLSADDLIKELTALRAAKSTDVDAGFSYGGTWNEAKESRAGIYYTQGGSLWHCNNNTRDRPGTSDKFTLAVKKGEAERLRA
jgi:hypothetical protein